MATQITVNRPLGCPNKLSVPGHHFSRGEIKQSKDNCDKSDHVVQEVVVEGYGHKFLRRDRINEFDMMCFDSGSCKKKNFDEVIEEVDQEFFKSLRRQKKSSGDSRFQYWKCENVLQKRRRMRIVSTRNSFLLTVVEKLSLQFFLPTIVS